MPLFECFLIAYAAVLVAGAWIMDRLARAGKVDW